MTTATGGAVTSRNFRKFLAERTVTSTGRFEDISSKLKSVLLVHYLSLETINVLLSMEK